MVVALGKCRASSLVKFSVPPAPHCREHQVIRGSTRRAASASAVG